MVEFYINRKRYSLTKDRVETAVRGDEPEVIQSLAVRVNDKWWPAKQPFVTALGLKNTDVNSRTALRNLEHLGFRTHDLAVDGPLPNDHFNHEPAGSGDLRPIALSLAVELLRAQTRDASEAITVAEAFLDWLSAPSAPD